MYDRNDYRTRAGREHSLGADQKYETSYGNYAGEYVATEEILKHRAARQEAQPKLGSITTESLIDILNHTLNTLHEEISGIERAISPVLRCSDPQPVKDPTPDGNHAPVNWALISLNERIGYEIERLIDIYKRAEVV